MLTGLPFRVSFVNTLPALGLPSAPLAEAVSSLAIICAAVTFTVTKALSQLVGFKTSQI